MDIPEANKKANISYAMIGAMIMMTFWVTTFYHNQSTIEGRMNKRYERTMDILQHIEERIDNIEKN